MAFVARTIENIRELKTMFINGSEVAVEPLMNTQIKGVEGWTR